MFHVKWIGKVWGNSQPPKWLPVARFGTHCLLHNGNTLGSLVGFLCCPTFPKLRTPLFPLEFSLFLWWKWWRKGEERADAKIRNGLASCACVCECMRVFLSSIWQQMLLTPFPSYFQLLFCAVLALSCCSPLLQMRGCMGEVEGWWQVGVRLGLSVKRVK